MFQDRSIAVWDMVSPTEINMRRVLVGHRAAVNVVDFDEKYIVSASGDRTIKVRYSFPSIFAPCNSNALFFPLLVLEYVIRIVKIFYTLIFWNFRKGSKNDL